MSNSKQAPAKAPAYAGAPIVDALAGLTGDRGAHCAHVAGIVADALRSLAQHGNSGPVLKAAAFLHSLKGSGRAVLATRDAFAAAVACFPFVTYSPASAILTDTRERKRGDAKEAADMAEQASEAFALAYGVRFNAPADKPAATLGDKQRKALALLCDMSQDGLARLLVSADAHGKLADAVSRAATILAVQRAAEQSKEAAKAAPRRVKAKAPAPASEPAAPVQPAPTSEPQTAMGVALTEAGIAA